MTRRMLRIGLGIGAALISAGLAVGLYASQESPGAAPPPAGPGRMGPMRGMGGPMGLLGPMRLPLGRLNLTDAQKDQIKSIVQSHRADWKGLADRAAEARRALNAAVTADPVNEDDIRSQSAALAAVQADMAVAAAHARGEIFQVLTPEQRDQAKTLQARMASRMQRQQSNAGRP